MRKRIFRFLLAVVGIVALLFAGVYAYVIETWNSPADNPVPTVTASNSPEANARGEFLFKYGLGCWQCHSTSIDPEAPPSGGQKFDLRTAGPGFGLFYAPNITPDPETGLGRWSDGEIVRAIREGVSKGGRKLFPLMPVTSFSGMSDDDVLALVSYLRKLPPVSNAVSPNELTFATKALFAFGVIKPEEPITEPIVAPAKAATPEYGRYVSMHAGLCSDCHTPRNLDDGSFFTDSLFAGSTFAFGEDVGSPAPAYARNITLDTATGIGSWSEEQFTTAVRLGIRPDGRVLLPHMPYPSFAFWDTTDIAAIYAFLRTLPAIHRKTPEAPRSSALTHGSGIERGTAIFAASCTACHGVEGRGTSFTHLALASMASTLSNDELRTFIRSGQPSLRMPPFGSTYTDAEIDDVIACIRTFHSQ